MLTCATLYADGLRLAWFDDTQKSDVLVQNSVMTPVVGCNTYHGLTPATMCVVVVECANLTNSEQIESSFIETYRSTPSTEQQFANYKNIALNICESAVGGGKALIKLNLEMIINLQSVSSTDRTNRAIM